MTRLTLRFRRPRNIADQFGQIFTPSGIAALLADALPSDGLSIIDLGAGNGALAKAALSRCPLARAVLVEHDFAQATILYNSLLPRTTIVHGDALSPGLLENLIGDTRDPIILSNPPYGTLRVSGRHFSHSKSPLQPVIDGAGWIRGDVAFLSRIYDASPRGTILGLVVASPIVCSPAYSDFRRVLLDTLSNLVVTELHPRTFSGAEVRAFLISGRRAVRRSRNVTLRLADETGRIEGELSVSYNAALRRLDYRYHATVSRLAPKADQTLGTVADLKCRVSRGSRSHGEFKSLGLTAFHTTNFVKSGELVSLDGARPGFNIATSGDILIPRVGSRCLLREARVVSGSGLITDCVYRICAPEGLREKVWNTLNSDFGREWRALFAEGSCAKYLTISSLNALPILR